MNNRLSEILKNMLDEVINEAKGNESLKGRGTDEEACGCIVCQAEKLLDKFFDEQDFKSERYLTLETAVKMKFKKADSLEQFLGIHRGYEYQRREVLKKLEHEFNKYLGIKNALKTTKNEIAKRDWGT